MEKINKFINLQLFADENENADVENNQDNKQAQSEAKKQEPKTQEDKLISKNLFDKVSSEAAQLKKKLRELEDKDKSNEQKAQDILAELEQAKADKQRELDELTVKFNKSTAIAELAELKGKLEFTEKDTEIDDLVNHLIELDGEKSKSKITAFKGLIEKVFTKGFESAKKGSWGAMSNQKSNNSTQSKKSDFLKYQEDNFKEYENKKINFK